MLIRSALNFGTRRLKTSSSTGEIFSTFGESCSGVQLSFLPESVGRGSSFLNIKTSLFYKGSLCSQCRFLFFYLLPWSTGGWDIFLNEKSDYNDLAIVCE